MMDTELLKRGPTGTDSRLKSSNAKSSFSPKAKHHNRLIREEHQIIEAVLEAKDEWVAASVDFNYADDDLLVDYHVYRLKACEARYAYFLKLAKEKGLTLNTLLS